MAYVSVTSPCISCGKLFSYHPHLVPSIRLNAERQADPNGTREPICRDCVERANPRRIANGLEPITYHPRAYDTAIEEGEVWD
jgi:hypothetical protein